MDNHIKRFSKVRLQYIPPQLKFSENKILTQAFSCEFWEMFHPEKCSISILPKIVKGFLTSSGVLKWNIWLKWVKNETPSQFFSCEFCNIFKRHIQFLRYHKMTATCTCSPFLSTCWIFVTLSASSNVRKFTWTSPLSYPMQNNANGINYQHCDSVNYT